MDGYIVTVEDAVVKVVDAKSGGGGEPVLYYDKYYALRSWPVKAVVC